MLGCAPEFANSGVTVSASTPSNPRSEKAVARGSDALQPMSQVEAIFITQESSTLCSHRLLSKVKGSNCKRSTVGDISNDVNVCNSEQEYFDGVELRLSSFFFKADAVKTSKCRQLKWISLRGRMVKARTSGLGDQPGLTEDPLSPCDPLRPHLPCGLRNENWIKLA